MLNRLQGLLHSNWEILHLPCLKFLCRKKVAQCIKFAILENTIIRIAWYDNAFPYRFHLAAPNRSLVVSDPLQQHCPIYEAGKHYVSAPVEAIAETILYYLSHEEERLEVVENAYRLVTTELTFGNSIKTIMDAVDRVRETVSE